MSDHRKNWSRLLLFLIIGWSLLAGCQNDEQSGTTARSASETLLALPKLEPADLAPDERLAVVATTSIIGDVVGRVGGDAIALTTLMEPGQDPHSYEPSTGDLQQAADADVIFVNGWQLEEGLIDNLNAVAEGVPLVPVSAGIDPLLFAATDDQPAGEEDDHEGPDPHVWLDPTGVEQWTENIATTLAALDPAQAETYRQNAEAYRQELSALMARMEAQLAEVPASQRRLVTNHQALAYFARAFDFEIIGTVIPAASTLAEPSPRALADLIAAMEQAGVCTIFTESTVSEEMAQTVTAELDQCNQVQVIPLYTGALGPAGSGADSYIGMMETNLEAIVAGVQG